MLQSLSDEMNISKKTKIRHRNELNKTLAQLPLPAKRVVYMALAPVDSKNPIEKGTVFRIRGDELAKIADISKSVAFRQLKEGAKQLISSSLSLTGDDLVVLAKDLDLPYTEKNKPSDIDLSITDYCAYFDNDGYLDLKFSRVIEPYISSLIGKKNKFTTQLLSSSVKLSGLYSSALYQLIRKNYSKFKSKNDFYIEINDLKDEIIAYGFNENGDIEYKYPEFPIFRRDVINKAVKEIKNKTEITHLEFETKKEGRRVVGVTFYFIVNEDVYSGMDNEFSSFTEEENEFFEKMDGAL
ncbi:replication initiation protein [Xenorhabdus entomophaga]|uniref:replication initiation protein n=1 Tax=Xenorhabdus entomophaga TaxID=3136257 RepID=UPI0030F43D81